jgi:hypothetical protein
VFHGLMSMYERCPNCDHKFEREAGYFYGAMYASYGFGFLTTFYWLPMLLAGVSPLWGNRHPDRAPDHPNADFVPLRARCLDARR